MSAFAKKMITYGRDLEEARTMVQDAIVCHIRGLVKDGEEIPEDRSRGKTIKEKLKVTIKQPPW